MNSQPVRVDGAFPPSQVNPRSAAAVSVPASAGKGMRPDIAPVSGDPPVSATQAASAAADVNRWLAENGSELTLEFDDSLGRTIFKLIDSQTGAVVRQIPSEEVLSVSRALADDAPSGALLRTDA